MSLPIIRSLLFVPGSRPERFAKAAGAGADIICIDLEDAVLPADKATARQAVVNYLKDNNKLVVRINHIASSDGIDDLTAMLNAENTPLAIMLPKTASADEIELVVSKIANTEIKIIALLESVAGVQNAAAIALADDRVEALMFGGADYSAEIGAEFSYEPLLLARSQLVQAKAAKSIQLIDVPHIDIKNIDELSQETSKVKALGFTGKAAIHPIQLDAIHQAFSPTNEEIEQAQSILASVTSIDAGVVVVNGRMIDRPIIVAAQRTMALANVATNKN
ncbi:HpcH/HpaI aldolase/citrate lyase family protein [Thalassomonas sp. M1454]|uniref:HpcH/HpaI aldolase/citrate lyase family protein n=1 Tax=Thalassomonas sp. M1454 TaxID=2594477 RepID=UPI001180E1CE|nr:CoA ester lyase [Thalassomonas sp. M1454]TRX55067.1 CoA ester lyase [Thalassomonas sp. M1454]